MANWTATLKKARAGFSAVIAEIELSDGTRSAIVTIPIRPDATDAEMRDEIRELLPDLVAAAKRAHQLQAYIDVSIDLGEYP